MDFRKDKEYLSDVEKKLYKKDADFDYEQQKLKQHEVDVGSDWKEPEKQTPKKKKVKLVQSPILVKLFFVSLIFFVLASSIALYRLFIDPIVSSPKNVEILIQAPASVTGGEETQIQVIVTNNNKATIESATLEITYPEGTDVVGVTEEESRKLRRELGVILPGQQVTETLNVVMFGEENTEKSFNLNLEYRTEGSSATFSKDKAYTFVLTTSPISLSFDIPDEVNAGEQVKLSVDVVSNSKAVLEDVQVVVEYPFGFAFSGANPSPTRDRNIWYLGDLSPSQRHTIEVAGTIGGEISDQKTFKVFVGRQDVQNEDEIDVVYNSIIRTVLIEEPFLAINFSINGDSVSDEVVVGSAKDVFGDIEWKNNLPSRILNGEFILTISGAIVDEESVNVSKGFYQSSNNSIVWNQTTDRTLSLIEPGESGSGRFSFKTKSLFGPGSSQFKNPEVQLTLEFRGERVSPGFENEIITFDKSKKLKVSSAAQLASYGTYYTGPFSNTGPVPPRVDQKTTYTITWSIANSSNNITDARVTASLPIYVRWLDIVSPQTETITFNDATGDIVWDVGNVSQGAGVTKSAREVSFQVELTPSLSQVNAVPVLVSEARFTGRDTFTNTQVDARAQSIDISLPQDPQFNSQTQGRVVP